MVKAEYNLQENKGKGEIVLTDVQLNGTSVNIPLKQEGVLESFTVTLSFKVSSLEELTKDLAEYAIYLLEEIKGEGKSIC